MDSFIIQIVTEDTEDYEGERFDSWNNTLLATYLYKSRRTLSIVKHKIILAIIKNKFSREMLNEFAV